MTWKRVATAAVLIPFVVGLVLFGSIVWVSLGLALIVTLAMLEYFALGEAIGHRAYRVWTIVCAILIILAQWNLAERSRLQLKVEVRSATVAARPADVSAPSVRPALFARGSFTLNLQDVLFLFALGVAGLTLWTKRPPVEALPAAGISASGLLLVAFPLSFAVRLDGLGGAGPRLLLFALVITWAGDTVAYFVGRAIGRHPFAPALSPKKTWEGAVAGFAGSLLVGYAFSWWLHASVPHLLAMAGVGNVAGQVGDLVESAYKRSAGVKDSGALLPGHGGVLDRIDALILAIPAVWYYWVLVYSPGH
jgi:phosphatidate cytidylyltransferase